MFKWGEFLHNFIRDLIDLNCEVKTSNIELDQ